MKRVGVLPTKASLLCVSQGLTGGGFVFLQLVYLDDRKLGASDTPFSTNR
jgi:hypothetical protein